jgi:tetratricopeptide (TPR) repeat protein
MGKYKKAIEYCNEALEINPGNKEAKINLSNAIDQMNKKKQHRIN